MDEGATLLFQEKNNFPRAMLKGDFESKPKVHLVEKYAWMKVQIYSFKREIIFQEQCSKKTLRTNI